MEFLMKNLICCNFGLYAAFMQQHAAAVVFLGIVDSNYPFLVWNDPNKNFQSIWTDNQWKIEYTNFFTYMLQICSSTQQQWFFLGIWILAALPNYKMSQMIIFSPFDAAFNEKSHMLHFWPVCCKCAAACSCNGFFWYFR